MTLNDKQEVAKTDLLSAIESVNKVRGIEEASHVLNNFCSDLKRHSGPLQLSYADLRAIEDGMQMGAEGRRAYYALGAALRENVIVTQDPTRVRGK